MRLVLQPLTADGAAPIALDFAPGQFVDIEIPGTYTRRSYSMASVAEDGRLEFFIRLLPDGSPQIPADQAKVGLRVALRGPGAPSCCTRASGRVFVAGGTGLSPVLSMIRQ